MTTVQQKVQAIEDKKHREALIERNIRNSKVAQMFFDDRQIKLYPLANMISTPETYETLQLPDPSGESAEKTASIFLNHMKVMTGGDASFAKSILSKLTKAGYDAVSLSFLNASMSDIKSKMRDQFKTATTNQDAVFLFLKKYVQTFDGNRDGNRDAKADMDTSLSKSTNTKTDILSRIQSAISDDEALQLEVESWAKTKGIMGINDNLKTLTKSTKLTKSDLQLIEDYVLNAGAGAGEAKIKGDGLKRKSYAGRGIQTNHISDKMYVDITHLNRNSLALKYKSTKKLIGKPQPVSDEQKDSIMSILHGNYTKKKYDNLKSGEKELVHDFAVASKAQHVQFITQRNELLNKFHVILGEIEAGNDAPELRKMLKDSTEQLMKSKGISRLEGLTILNQLMDV